MTISIICACKNRNDALRVSLNSWLTIKEIGEIIIVDWSSDEPLNYLTKLDSRIKVVRVEGKKYFNQPQPLNLAASIASGDYILKADTDYIINPYFNFIEKYFPNENSFTSGRYNYESPEYYDEKLGNYAIDKTNMSSSELEKYFNSYSPLFKYLTGLLFITKENFNKVGGYNENLGKLYAYEDDELVQRLKCMGLEENKLDYDYFLIHLPHQDKKRTENFEGHMNDDEYCDDVRNRLRQYYNSEELEWQVEYALSLRHITENKNIIGEIKDYYIKSKTKWNIIRIDEQNYFAEEIMEDVIVENRKKMEGFPTVYYLSLEECGDRRRELENQFKKYNILPKSIISKRFSESNDNIQGKYVYQLNDGTKGCCVSHLKAIKQWYDTTDEDYAFFCEDDISLETVQYWDFTWEEFIESLPEDAECVQLFTIRSNYDTFELRERYWDDWGASAYILTRNYAKKIIDTYIKSDFYLLEIPNQEVMPLIENILFASIGKCYTYPLFVEEIKFESTFVGKDDDVTDGQKNNHYVSYKKVIEWWKSKSSINFKSIKEIKVRPKIVDCFPYFNEKELLELRINLLKDYVDEFVIIDANYTHSGDPKPFTCKQTIKELGLFSDKIKVIEADLTDIGEASDYDLYFNPDQILSSRERLQRDFICNYLDDYTDDTVFIISDCDEIINPNNISFLTNLCRQHSSIFKIPLVHLEGYANLRAYNIDGTPSRWDKSMFLCLKNHLKEASPTHIRSEFRIPYEVVYATQDGNILQDLGWHFTWMGGSENYILKFKSFCHCDDDVVKLLENDHIKCKDDLFDYMNDYVPGKGKISPSGNTRIILCSYDTNLLPKLILDLPRVREYLLPKKIKQIKEKTELEQLLTTYSMDTENSENNFNLGVWYENNGHTAPALSYFLRCAERAEDKNLAYEALIRSSYCYDKQGTRDGSAKSLLEQALCLLPKRPEAYYLLSRFAEKRQWWQDCYIYAEQGLMYSDLNSEKLRTDVEYPGKYGLLFEKSISSWWWGKVDEAKFTALELKNNYILPKDYLQILNNNLKVMGLES